MSTTSEREFMCLPLWHADPSKYQYVVYIHELFGVNLLQKAREGFLDSSDFEQFFKNFHDFSLKFINFVHFSLENHGITPKSS